MSLSQTTPPPLGPTIPGSVKLQSLQVTSKMATPTPTADDDAANRGYVDAVAFGVSNINEFFQESVTDGETKEQTFAVKLPQNINGDLWLLRIRWETDFASGESSTISLIRRRNIDGTITDTAITDQILLDDDLDQRTWYDYDSDVFPYDLNSRTDVIIARSVNVGTVANRELLVAFGIRKSDESVNPPPDMPFRTLTLTSICNPTPTTHRWRIRNQNYFNLVVSYRVSGTSTSGQITATANSDTFFIIERGTTIITYENDGTEYSQTKAPNSNSCS